MDAVVALAGEPLFGKRWSAELKQRFVESRVGHIDTLVAWMKAHPPRVVLGASAIGIYGDTGARELDESAPVGKDYAANLCVQWERAAERARELGARVCTLRIGLVLGQGGGVLAQMAPMFRKGLGGRIGSGEQYMSWIHLEDMVGLIVHALDTDELEGPLNCTAPQPVTNKEFPNTLAAAYGKRKFLPTPGFVLRLAVGEGAYMILTGQRVLPHKAQASGYAFEYTELDRALQTLCS